MLLLTHLSDAAPQRHATFRTYTPAFAHATIVEPQNAQIDAATSPHIAHRQDKVMIPRSEKSIADEGAAERSPQLRSAAAAKSACQARRALPAQRAYDAINCF